MSVMIVTSLGEVVVDLFTDRCPLTCKNFLKLCKIKYYNGCLFHTIQKDFTAQTGDPTGTGAGGDSVYKFLYGDQARFFGDEIHLDLKHSKRGTVAMANAGENLNASQFYLTLRDDLDYLDGKHTVFGEVAEGFDTLDRLNEAYVDEKSRPYKNIRIKHTYVLDDPFDDPPQLAELIPEASPDGKPKEEVDDDVRLEDDWVPMDEQLNAEELEEVLRSKQAHSSAVVLESMDNALIDDRRIHVDFSQSVAKLWSEYRRKDRTGKGGGCYKCGSLDHIARDCIGDSTGKQQQPRYVLKDENKQRGGGDNSRYEMVFGEEATESPTRLKRHRHYEAEKDGAERNTKQRDPDDTKNWDNRRRDSHDSRKFSERSKEYREDEKYHRNRVISPSEEREYKTRDERDHRSRRGGRNEEKYETKYANDGGRRDKKDERAFGKRHGEGPHHAERRLERDSRKTSGDEHIRGSARDERWETRDNSYEKKMGMDKDNHEGLREQRSHRRRSYVDDDSVDRDRSRKR